jgi:apolipoprotein N-acyltransferase
MLKSSVMRLIPARAWALIFLSAILQIAIFPVAGPLPVWRAALSWFALIPFLLAILLPDRNNAPLKLINATLLGYLCGILWYIGNCYWIYQTMHQYGGIPKPISFLILILFALYLGLYHALFAAVIGLLRTSRVNIRGALVLTPFVWVAVELARARITSFPWDLLGYSQVNNSVLTSLAPLAGVMAISFVIASINAAIVPIFLSARKRLIPGMAVAIAILLQLTGSLVTASPATAAGLTNTAVMMQENLEVGAVGKDVTPLGLTDEIAQFSAWSLHPQSPAGSATHNGNPTVIIWPEAPSHLISNDPYFRAAMTHLARTAKAPVIAGSLGVDRSSIPPRGYFLYDSASLFDAAGNYAGRYDKIHLVPWGEYIPYKQFFSFADRLTEGVGDMDRGQTRTVFATGGHTYGVFVCYESIFGDEVRQFAKNGAEVLVNISDDGWYGDSGAPWQHLNMARMRAIENHRWLLRSTNTGITTAIDPQGHMAAQAPRHVRAAFIFPFAFTPASTLTFYTRHGDWFAYLCTLVTLVSLGLARVNGPRAHELK